MALGIRSSDTAVDRALEDLGQPEIGVQLLPDGGARRAAGQAVHQHQLLADPKPALQYLGLDALQLGVAFEQRLETCRVLGP